MDRPIPADEDNLQDAAARPRTPADVPLDQLQPFMLTDQKVILKYLLTNATSLFDGSVLAELSKLEKIHPEMDPYCQILQPSLWGDETERRKAMEMIFKAEFIEVSMTPFFFCK